MDFVIELIIGAVAGVFVLIFWMALPWMPATIIAELKKEYDRGEWINMIFHIPNAVIATLPFWLVYGVYDHRGVVCAVAFAGGLFWFYFSLLWAFLTSRGET